eukprot:364293-Chlamydomonas_euryale.AAC.7
MMHISWTGVRGYVCEPPAELGYCLIHRVHNGAEVSPVLCRVWGGLMQQGWQYVAASVICEDFYEPLKANPSDFEHCLLHACSKNALKIILPHSSCLFNTSCPCLYWLFRLQKMPNLEKENYAIAETHTVDRKRHGLKDHFDVPPATTRLTETRRVAHKTWLWSTSAAAQNARDCAHHKADAADEEGQARRCAGNMRVWTRTAKDGGMQYTRDAVLPAVQGRQGVLQAGGSGVREALRNHFETLFGGESDVHENHGTVMQWLRQAAAGRQVDRQVAEGYGRPPAPDLKELHACIQALRSHAAP